MTRDLAVIHVGQPRCEALNDYHVESYVKTLFCVLLACLSKSDCASPLARVFEFTQGVGVSNGSLLEWNPLVLNKAHYVCVAAAGSLVLAALLSMQAAAETAAAGRADALSRGAADSLELTERGKYLTLAGNCASCHTTSDGQYMAGGLGFATPFGLIYSTNITPDPETGIGNWSEREFLDSLRHGIRPDGEHLYPVFPYTAFTKVTDEDVSAIYAYLNSIPAVHTETPENDLPFPFNVRALMAVWKFLFFDEGAFETDPSRSVDWNRGAYLVEALAHCGACHTPRNLLGGPEPALAMSGGEYVDHVGDDKYRPWSAPNLTGASRGLGLWSEDDLLDYLLFARNDFLESFGPMNEVIMNSTRHLRREDVGAMAVYLKSLAVIGESESAAPEAGVMGRGRTVYNLHCGTCHLPTGEGDPEMAPRLNAGSLVVQSDNPASMINAILYGPASPHPALSEKWRKPMEEFQWMLDDEEVAAVASFIRNSWNNSAGLVSPDDVARQR